MDEKVLTKKYQDVKENVEIQLRTETKLSIIVAIYSFGESVSKLFSSLKTSLNSTYSETEIIFVDDGSPDDTWKFLKKIADENSEVKVIRLRSNSGEAAIFDAGLKASKGRNILFLNGSKRINPNGIESLVKKLEEGYDLVMGMRFPRSDSKLNQVISKLFNWIVKKSYGLKLHDINSGIFIANRSIFDEIQVYGDMGIFLPVLTNRKGFRVTEVEVEQLEGSFRKSKFVSEYLQRLLDLISVTFLINYSKKPLHFLGFLGLVFSFVGVVMNGYLFIYRILGYGGIAGRPLLLVGALLLVIGIQMISIGLIAEIIIFTHARNLKEYSVEEILN